MQVRDGADLHWQVTDAHESIIPNMRQNTWQEVECHDICCGTKDAYEIC